MTQNQMYPDRWMIHVMGHNTIGMKTIVKIQIVLFPEGILDYVLTNWLEMVCVNVPIRLTSSTRLPYRVRVTTTGWMHYVRYGLYS